MIVPIGITFKAYAYIYNDTIHIYIYAMKT